MKTALALFVAMSFVACRDVAGIHSIAFDDSGSMACTGSTPTLVFSSTQTYDKLFAQTGFVYAEISQSGIDRCAIGGCTTPTNIFTATSNDTYEDTSISAANVNYTLQKNLADGGVTGEIHALSFDGTSDTVSTTTPLYPTWIATSGTRIFWVNGEYESAVGTDPDAVQCTGCSASITPWITSLAAGSYGLMADANNVYVLADAANLTDLTLLSCSVQTACNASPRTVISALDESTLPTQMASDGTNVYVARNNHADVVRVDTTGAVTETLTSQDVAAIAVDATSNQLYYATSTGVVGRVKTDGTQNVTLACNQDTVTAITVDDQNIYFLAGSTTANIYKLPK